MKTTTKKKPVVEQAPTATEKKYLQMIELLTASNESLRKSFEAVKANYEREKNRLDKIIDSHLNVTKCQK